MIEKKCPFLWITVDYHSESLSMSNVGHRDGFFYPTLTLILSQSELMRIWILLMWAKFINTYVPENVACEYDVLTFDS